MTNATYLDSGPVKSPEPSKPPVVIISTKNAPEPEQLVLTEDYLNDFQVHICQWDKHNKDFKGGQWLKVYRNLFKESFLEIPNTGQSLYIYLLLKAEVGGMCVTSLSKLTTHWASRGVRAADLLKKLQENKLVRIYRLEEIRRIRLDLREEEISSEQIQGKDTSKNKEGKQNPNKEGEVKTYFDYEAKKFIGVKQYLEQWQKDYPDINVIEQVKKAGQWLLNNPDKKRDNIKGFLINWFKKGKNDKIKNS